MHHDKRQKPKVLVSSSMLGQTKGQVAETMTWVVATIIIIVILVISVYAASILSDAVKILSGSDSIPLRERGDFTGKESLLAILLTNSGEKKVFDQLNLDGKTDAFSDNLFDEVLKNSKDDFLSIDLSRDEFEASIGVGSNLILIEKVRINQDVSLELNLKILQYE